MAKSQLRLRLRRVALVVVAALLLLVGGFVLRVTVFVPRFDVPSIAATPQYKDPALLERAWALPVAATYGRRLDYQTNPSVCGPASVANALRSFGIAGASQGTVLAGTGKRGTGMCFMGLTLDDAAEVARHSGRKVTLLRDLSISELRDHLRRANDPSRRTLINFHRGLLFGKGTGHHSPIGGYLEAEDLVFVLDVNGTFGPWLVSTERLFTAMDSIDSSSGKKRGLLVLE